MHLSTLSWGSGDRVALLIHGMLGAATQYHQLGPALADRGYHAIAVDLPGHGTSPPAPGATLSLFADALVETVSRLDASRSGSPRPALAVGHSLGAVLLSYALPRLRPHRAVYVDTPLDTPSAAPPVVDLREHFLAARSSRTEQHLRASHPSWSLEDCRVEAEAARRFDIETAVALQRSYTGHTTGSATIPSLVIAADPSRYVSPERARELAELGFTVRSVPGAGHSVWYGQLGEFVGILDAWLG
ncbi:alpha/beta fold hydrolase [Kribbella hippodromi]|uniref:Alpha/beta fold hydrolase n=1 Tax=Kribbella hippodromi TaxID=434347 RepID=A0ABP4NVG4_9ACTN